MSARRSQRSKGTGMRRCAAALLVIVLCPEGAEGASPKSVKGVDTSPAPHLPWSPPPHVTSGQAPAPITRPSIPGGLPAGLDSWTLADVVDMALRNSPETRAAWASARSAAAELGSRKGDYYPDVDLSASANKVKGSAVGGMFSYSQRTFTTAADLHYTLFDFGGTRARVREARQALIAANWDHNAAIQDVVLQVEQAYYLYLANKALLIEAESAMEEAQANLDAATERHRVGVATVADVLQTKTAAAQARLALISLEGQIQTTRGSLATAMGLPANTPFDVELPEDDLQHAEITATVEAFLETALARRPDLARARALVMEAEARLKGVKAEGYPSITTTASASHIHYLGESSASDTYSLGLQVRFPLFTGFSHTHDVRQAQADLEEEMARAQGLEQAAILEVWIAYYGLKTASQRLLTTEELIKSATESHEVALGRYKAGVGSILDLLAAQTALNSARAQRVQAHADWFLSLAQLAHDTGTLGLSKEGSVQGSPAGLNEENPR